LAAVELRYEELPRLDVHSPSEDGERLLDATWSEILRCPQSKSLDAELEDLTFIILLMMLVTSKAEVKNLPPNLFEDLERENWCYDKLKNTRI
jgi:hypothetical protein